MMLKLWQKKPKLNYSKDVLDIVQYGSSVVETFEALRSLELHDIDIAVIFNKIPLNEQLNQAQEIKKQIQKISQLPVHIKSFDLYSFFDISNFAKEGILFYGKSLISGDYFAKSFGFNPRIQIFYSLKDFKKKGKVKFHYMLKGKKKEYGLLRKYGGELLKPGLIEIFPEHEGIFVNAIKRLTNNFKVRRVIFL